MRSAPRRAWSAVLALLAQGACGPPRPIEPALALVGDEARGAATYQITCAGCHGPEGGGIAAAPALANTLATLDDVTVMTVMLRGRGGMPAKRITDQEAADVLRFVRGRWGGPPPSAPAAPPEAGAPR